MLQICRRGQKSTNCLRRSEAGVEAYYADSKLDDPGDDSSSEEEVISAPGRDKGPEKPNKQRKKDMWRRSQPQTQADGRSMLTDCR
jgi:hypothetical protein